MNKWDFIIAELSLIKPDVIAISETWIVGSRDVFLYSFENYIPFFNSRRNSRGGGTLLLINPLLAPCLTLISYELSTSDAYNIRTAIITIGDCKVYVASVYRPPWASRDDLKSLINDLSMLTRRNTPSIY